MIPKIIHYCWFGRNPLPESAVKCIDSWKKFFPDYEIKEWNEDNFDVNIIPYTKEAYEAKKYAFVSDYARFWILYHHGGLYFDTDVEVIKSMDHIIKRGPFMGIEKLNPDISDVSTSSLVAPGLGLSSSIGHPIYAEILKYYESLHWCDSKGQQLPGTVVHHTTDILERYGYQKQDVEQEIGGIVIYPSEVFCPMDSTTGLIDITEKTVSIHWYSCSWIDHNSMRFKLHLLKNWFVGVFGDWWLNLLYNCLKKMK